MPRRSTTTRPDESASSSDDATQRLVSMRYTRCVDLLDDLHAALADGS
jgi:hypothetical protein